jgi:hypothetical protein
MSPWEGPVFLVGMPRSGTKLLRNLLTQHERVRIPTIETEFLPYLVEWVSHHGRPADRRSFERLFIALRRSTYFDYRAGRQPEFSWATWFDHCRGRYDATGLFEGFIRYETGASPGSAIIWGDKSPSYIRHIELLLSMFEYGRVIHIVRDVRDFALSMRKAWGKDIQRAAFRWGLDTSVAHQVIQQHADRCIEVTYEALTSDVDAQLSRLCRFLGVDFDRSMTALPYSSENLGDTRGQVGVVSNNSGKFRSGLSSRELEAVESLAWNAMLTFGYQPQSSSGPRALSAPSLFTRKIKDGLNLVVRDVEARGVTRSLAYYFNQQRFNG